MSMTKEIASLKLDCDFYRKYFYIYQENFLQTTILNIY